jgi:hypothetical protein
MICPAFLLIPQPEGNHRRDVLQIRRLLIAAIVHCCAERTKIAAKQAQQDCLTQPRQQPCHAPRA